MSRTAAIIQARMSSTRLPGKILMPVLDKPLLHYQIERLKLCELLNDIILATTTNPADDCLVRFAEENRIPWFRGSELDVLDRYYQCATANDIEHVVRITSDCPLIDPILCDHLIAKYRITGVDYAHTGATFAEGLDCEIFSSRILCEAHHEANLPSEREHVALFFHNRPKRYTILALENTRDDSAYRLTLDEQEDYIVLRHIIEALYPLSGNRISMEDIRQFLSQNHHIFSINSFLQRNAGLAKSLKEDELYVASK